MSTSESDEREAGDVGDDADVLPDATREGEPGLGVELDETEAGIGGTEGDPSR